MVKRRLNPTKRSKSNDKKREDDKMVIDDFGKMTKDQLKILLKEHGLSVVGTKANLIARLEENIMEDDTKTLRRPNDTTSNSNGNQWGMNSDDYNNHVNSRKEVRDKLFKSRLKTTTTAAAATSTIENTDYNSQISDPDNLTLWQHPIITLNYFLRELFIDIKNVIERILCYKKTVWFIFLIIGSTFVLKCLPGPQQGLIKSWESTLLWGFYWIGLGVLSSVGLGTGLHTFVLYLGPHIAAVTMAAYECGGLNFPEPPYPDSIICPDKIDPNWTAGVLNIMRKVRLEAMLWGAGTALGELPPYFMARAARNSRQLNNKNDQEDLKELEALEALENGENIPIIMRLKLMMKHFVQKAGFFGILVCASIPNPLFDLAGLTCGHYRIPFWTFFGATLIGKAVIKMHIQQLAVIIAFNEELLDKFIGLLAFIPYIGLKFQEPIKRYMVEQKNKLHNKTSTDGSNLIAWLFDKFVMLMVCYFLITIIHALARNHHRRRTKMSTD